NRPIPPGVTSRARIPVPRRGPTARRDTEADRFRQRWSCRMAVGSSPAPGPGVIARPAHQRARLRSILAPTGAPNTRRGGMERFLVTGGNRLVGEVSVGGAKNSLLKLIAAALLTEGTTTITNCPAIRQEELTSEL